MSFDISYIFTAKDKYTGVGKKVASVNRKVKESSNQVTRSLTKKNTALRKMQASLLVAKRRLASYRKQSSPTAKSSSMLTGKIKQLAAIAIAGIGIANIIKEGAALEDALADSPEVVFICNPTSLHMPVTQAAAEKGSNLFIEKPLSHNLIGIKNLISLVEAKNLVVSVGFQHRFHPPLLQQLFSFCDLHEEVCSAKCPKRPFREFNLESIHCLPEAIFGLTSRPYEISITTNGEKRRQKCAFEPNWGNSHQ